MLEGTLGLLYFNAVIPKSSCMIVVSSCSVWGVAQLLLTKAGEATTMQKAATAARLMVIFSFFLYSFSFSFSFPPRPKLRYSVGVKLVRFLNTEKKCSVEV